MDVDQHLVRCGVRFSRVGQAQAIDTFKGIANNCTHFILRDVGAL